MNISIRHLRFSLINENVDRVFSAMERLVGEAPELCKCEVCLLDVAAIALNRLPARYRTTPFAELPGGVLDLVPEESEEGEEAIRQSVEDAVKEAIDQVKRHPRH